VGTADSVVPTELLSKQSLRFPAVNCWAGAAKWRYCRDAPWGVSCTMKDCAGDGAPAVSPKCPNSSPSSKLLGYYHAVPRGRQSRELSSVAKKIANSPGSTSLIRHHFPIHRQQLISMSFQAKV
jgi:hypothetical protein